MMVKNTGVKSPEMKALEDAFTQLKMNKNGSHDVHLQNIARILKRRYDMNITIHVVNNNGYEFFGMNVYPSISAIDIMVDQMIKGTNHVSTINSIWAVNKEWNIDIDSQLLHDVRINANPAECVAILLHEIGHTVASNEVPERVSRVVKYSYIHLPIKVKKVMQWTKARSVLGLTIIEACSNKNFHSKSVREELKADGFVIKEGYGNDLDTFIGKLITKSGNRLIDRTGKELDAEIDTVMAWVITNVSELEFRKNVLNKNLKDQILTNRSPFVRDYLLRIRSLFYGDEQDRYNDIVKEQRVIEEFRKYQIVTEAFKDFFTKDGRVEKVTDSDIDIVLIEAGRVQNENDRIYVLELIYAKLDIIEVSLDLLTNTDTSNRVQTSRAKLLQQKEELMAARKNIMSIRFQPKDFNVLVNYPKGYEG